MAYDILRTSNIEIVLSWSWIILLTHTACQTFAPCLRNICHSSVGLTPIRRHFFSSQPVPFFNSYMFKGCSLVNYLPSDTQYLLWYTFFWGEILRFWLLRSFYCNFQNNETQDVTGGAKPWCLVNKFHARVLQRLAMYWSNCSCVILFLSLSFFLFKEGDLYFSVTFPDCKAITGNGRRPHKYANRREITGFNGSAFK